MHMYLLVATLRACGAFQVGPDIVLTVLANKADLKSARAVPHAESRGVAAAVGASYFEVSALTGTALAL